MACETFESKSFRAPTLRTELDALIDAAAWSAAKADESVDLALLETAAAKWREVENFLAEAPS